MKVIVKLDDELDKEFRAIVGRTRGMYRGVLRIAIQEAFKDWIEKHRNDRSVFQQPVPVAQRAKVKGKNL